MIIGVMYGCSGSGSSGVVDVLTTEEVEALTELQGIILVTTD